MKILFIGDIVGEPGRKIIARQLPKLVAQHAIDVVLGNGENAAGGFGITPDIAQELFDYGIDVITTGNHVWDKKEILEYIKNERKLLRPANYPDSVPGKGSVVIETTKCGSLGVLQLMGRVNRPLLDCPFQVAERAIETLHRSVRTIVVDMHAEATSEKMAMGWHLDGRVSAVLGSHTHVQTVDARILPQGTAYLTDMGMTGPINGVIGMKKELSLERFLTHMPRRLEVAKGPCVLSGAVVEVDHQSGTAVSIERVQVSD
jgi:metallophosphoesterase (TIGR00282 family)